MSGGTSDTEAWICKSSTSKVAYVQVEKVERIQTEEIYNILEYMQTLDAENP